MCDLHASLQETGVGLKGTGATNYNRSFLPVHDSSLSVLLQCCFSSSQQIISQEKFFLEVREMSEHTERTQNALDKTLTGSS